MRGDYIRCSIELILQAITPFAKKAVWLRETNRTTGRFLAHGWFLMLLVTLLRLRSGKTVVAFVKLEN